MIDRETVDRIYAAANIVDIIGEYVTLKRKGVNYQACCPFHNEKTPSFVVSPSKGVYKCFGCGKGGNAVTFLMEHENITYPEALKMVAKRYGIDALGAMAQGLFCSLLIGTIIKTLGAQLGVPFLTDIGTYAMYLSTVHPLLLLYTYGCLICYRNKGVITE